VLEGEEGLADAFREQLKATWFVLSHKPQKTASLFSSQEDLMWVVDLVFLVVAVAKC